MANDPKNYSRFLVPFILAAFILIILFSSDRVFSGILAALGFLLIGVIPLFDMGNDLLREGPRVGAIVKPYSFARFQIWLWTMVIVPAFCIHWGFSTDLVPEINRESLILLGIAGATTLTSMTVGSAQEEAKNRTIQNMPAAVVSATNAAQSAQQSVATAAQNVQAAEQKLTAANTANQSAQNAVNQNAVANAQIGQQLANSALAVANRNLELANQNIINASRQPTVKADQTTVSLFTDILMDEKGQSSIARLQNLTFTFIYVGIYISLFITDWEYPEFDDTAFMLMGISSGTYLMGKGLNK